jgi:hypothetical protein
VGVAAQALVALLLAGGLATVGAARASDTVEDRRRSASVETGELAPELRQARLALRVLGPDTR